MNVLIIGGGGREHAIILALKKNPRIGQIFAMPGNGGIAAYAQTLDGSPIDGDLAVRYCAEHHIGFAVVAPDDPLVKGVADILRAAGIPVFGPSAKAAAIEGSKIFAKQLMQKYDIPTAAFEVFDDADAALSYLKTAPFPAVIKADGLALGKGVVIAKDYAEAAAAVKSMMVDKTFGESGNRIIIEEMLTGPEVTVLAFTDSKTILPLASSMDHKRALDGDRGLNTGGMGVIAPNPFYTAEIAALCMERIFLTTIHALAAEGRPFKGCLYFGLMLTKGGEGGVNKIEPKVIEYNCRFGDPEAQTVLPLLETDLFDIMCAVEEERLSEISLRQKKGAACTVMLCSRGYPEKYETGFPITGLDAAHLDAAHLDAAHLDAVHDDNTFVFHSGTKIKDGHLVTAGGRVLGITAVRDTLENAVKGAYAAAEKVHFENRYFRSDIGAAALKREG